MTPEQKEDVRHRVVGLLEELHKIGDLVVYYTDDDRGLEIGEYADLIVSVIDALAASQPAPAADTDNEAYEIGKRDGYEQAVQDIDLRTGGDGEYRFCTNEDPDRHTPTPEAMIQRIVDRFGDRTAVAAGQALGVERLTQMFYRLMRDHGSEIDWRGHADQTSFVPAIYSLPHVADEAIALARLFLQPAPAADTGQAVDPAHLAAINGLIRAGNQLSVCAQTTGGVAGADEGLREAIAEWEKALSMAKDMKRIAKYEPDHPAPLNAERVREDYLDELFLRCPDNAITYGYFMGHGAMLPADRAALRQKEGKA